MSERLIVGRIYLEDVSGPLGRLQATYGVHPRLREPQVRYLGRVYVQALELPEGWVYRTIDVARGGDSDPLLSEFCSDGDAGWVRPSDWPAVPDVAGDAKAAFDAALKALGSHPAHAEFSETVKAAIVEASSRE